MDIITSITILSLLLLLLILVKNLIGINANFVFILVWILVGRGISAFNLIILIYLIYIIAISRIIVIFI